MGKKICNSCINSAVFGNNNVRNDSLLEKFVFFCFSVFPGAGQMYLGLFRRGLQLMLTFIAGITILAYASMESFMALIIIPTWFYSFFDSYYVRKRIRNGENVEDTEAFSYSILTENKLYVGIALVLLGVISLANTFQYAGWYGPQVRAIYYAVRRSLVPLVFIVIGAVVLLKSRSAQDETAE